MENKKALKKIISSLYKIIRIEQDENTFDVKNKWELELNTMINDSDWEHSWVEWYTCLNSPNWKEFSWKLRMRHFRTPIITGSFDKNISALCWRNCGHLGDFAHIFWECPKIKEYWEEVNKEIKKMLNVPFSFKIHQVILGDIPDVWENDKMYMLNVAHKVITAN